MDVISRISCYGPTRMHVANEFITRRVGRKCIKVGDSVIDLGANEGFHTFDFTDIVGPEGLVHAFEPNPGLWKNFVEKPSVRLWPIAVGDELSIQKFYIPEEQSYHQVGSIVDPRDFLGNVGMAISSVPQIPLDMIDELFKKPITFAKIDVERRELFALRGMAKLLDAFNPTIVLENVNKEIQDFMASIGYDFFPLAACDKLDIFANSIAIHRNNKDNIDLIIPSETDLHEILSWLEAQYPDDIK